MSRKRSSPRNPFPTFQASFYLNTQLCSLPLKRSSSYRTNLEQTEAANLRKYLNFLFINLPWSRSTHAPLGSQRREIPIKCHFEELTQSLILFLLFFKSRTNSSKPNKDGQRWGKRGTNLARLMRNIAITVHGLEMRRFVDRTNLIFKIPRVMKVCLSFVRKYARSIHNFILFYIYSSRSSFLKPSPAHPSGKLP